MSAYGINWHFIVILSIVIISMSLCLTKFDNVTCAELRVTVVVTINGWSR